MVSLTSPWKVNEARCLVLASLFSLESPRIGMGLLGGRHRNSIRFMLGFHTSTQGQPHPLLSGLQAGIQPDL